MFYKFMGGTEEVLLDVFDKAVVDGVVKFASVLNCNDPFEFKFTTVKPSRAEFDKWHAEYDPHRTTEELENAWSSFSGPASDFNTNLWPRVQLMGHCFVLCVARKWNSHLMWAHYGESHSGFVVCYRPTVIDALAKLPSYGAGGDVRYLDRVPELQWFTSSQSEMLAPILRGKSTEWAYEEEYRVILHGSADERTIFEKVDPNQIAGVILGARACPALEARALAIQEVRKDFEVERVTAKSGEFQLRKYSIDPNARSFSEIL